MASLELNPAADPLMPDSGNDNSQQAPPKTEDTPSPAPIAEDEAKDVPEDVPTAEPEATTPPAAEDVPEDTPEDTPVDVPPTEPEAEDKKSDTPLMMTKDEVMARVMTIVERGETSDRQELDLLKQLYYRYHNAEALAARQAFIEAGGDANDYVPQLDPTEEQFKTAMQTIRQRRSDLQASLERERQENLKKKLAVIEKIKLLATTPEEANKSYENFRTLLNEWKEIGAVPAEQVTELWKNYHLYVEQFYDMLKLNSQMREYDFRKNLEAKVVLCEQAEKLSDEKDVIAALSKLQTLHQEWKEIGPIAKELREEMWNRFREASTVIRKRHQEFFEQRKAREEENLASKTELCEKAEAIDIEELTTFAAWDKKTKEMIDLQAQWKTIGYAPQKQNAQVFERFRSACDKFFKAKSEFFKNMRANLDENLRKKTELCEKAEALQDSTDWRATTEAILALQKEWKETGAVPHKVSEQLWKRFIGACNVFFDAKNKAQAQLRSEQKENLKAKKAVIAELKALAESDADDTTQKKLAELQEQWNQTGHVPRAEKDKVYGQYHDALDVIYKKLNISGNERRLTSFRTSLRVTSEQGGNSNLQREKERLVRAHDIMQNEIQTYENNLSFLSVSSKSGNSLAQEVMRKVERLKEELSLLGEKIKAINEEIRKGGEKA